jgi:serine/threonine-protein kinase
MILGTAAYMAPEQARGRAVDKRADIWAFGCVLYEMLTGRRAFEGEDVSDTLAAVLRGDPDWSALPSGLSPALTTTLRRCLERDPRRRVGDISTVRFVLDEHDRLASAAPSVAAQPDPAVLQSRVNSELARLRRQLMTRRVAPLAIALAGAAVALAIAVSRLATPSEPVPITRFSIEPTGLITTLVRPLAALSPDGSQLVYLAGGRAHLRQLADFEARPIPSADLPLGATLPVFSPDAKWIAFHSGSDRTIRKIEVRGGPLLRVCDAPSILPTGLSWDASGILVGLEREGIMRCDPAGGAAEQLVKLDATQMAGSPTLLPDGDGLLFALGAAGAEWDDADIVVQSLRTGSRRTILKGGSDPRFVSTGHLVYRRAGVMFAVPFDATRQEVRGDAVSVIEGVRRSGGLAFLSLSQTGVAAYLPGPAGSVTSRGVGIADRSGAVTRLSLPDTSYTHVRTSPDGSTLAIGTDDGTQGIVWLYPLSGAAAMQRLTTAGSNRYPIWSPDGRSVAFQSDRGGQNGIYRQRVDGSGPAERLTTSGPGESHIPEAWSRDGRYISFAVVHAPERFSLATVALDSGAIEPFDAATSTAMPGSSFSPDGRWLAYARAPNADLGSSDRGVFIRPFPRGDGIYQAPRLMVDFHPVWRADGRELIYVASTTAGQMAAVGVTTGSGVTFGTPALFQARVTGDRLSPQTRAFDLLPDGRFVGILTEQEERRSAIEIRVVLNWTEELKRLAPLP